MNSLERLADLVQRWTGIDLARGGRSDSLERLVTARMKELGLASAEVYVDSLTSAAHPEVGRLINAVTVNHSWFFRDAEQLGVIAEMLRDGRIAPSGERVDIWVPGCAAGEDVYSLAMLTRQAGRTAHVLGTDINSEVISLASRGHYGEWSARELPSELRHNLMRAADGFEVAAPLRSQVAFERHNLIDPAPNPPGTIGWHVVLCRNVLIYFTREKIHAAIESMGRALRRDGRLLLGATEILQTVPRDLRVERVGQRFVLRRANPGEPAAPEARSPPIKPPQPRPSFPEPTLPTLAAPRHVQSGIAAMISLGNSRLEAGETSEALALYAKALEMDPLNAEARFFTGVAYHISQDPSSAAQSLRGALVLDPELWPASFYLALSYDKLGRTADAKREYRRVFEAEGRALALQSRSALLADLTAFRKDVVRIARARAGK
jgi:chemotaxis protein methyltransferase CheR